MGILGSVSPQSLEGNKKGNKRFVDEERIDPKGVPNEVQEIRILNERWNMSKSNMRNQGPRKNMKRLADN